MSVVGVLQARVSSSRLPGKVLAPLLGVPMLLRQIERLRRCRQLDQLLVATSDEPEDDAIFELCNDVGLSCFRGSLNDVLDRFYKAVDTKSARHVVRLTGDCPLADWELIDRMISFGIDGDYDYASNTIRPTWPDGLDVEIMRFSALREAWCEAKLPSEREHVTSFFSNRPERFRLGSMTQDRDLSALRWTVDEPEDFAFVTRIYEELYPRDSAFTTDSILTLLDRQPSLMGLNGQFERNAGLLKSKEADREHLSVAAAGNS